MTGVNRPPTCSLRTLSQRELYEQLLVCLIFRLPSPLNYDGVVSSSLSEESKLTTSGLEATLVMAHLTVLFDVADSDSHESEV